MRDYFLYRTCFVLWTKNNPSIFLQTQLFAVISVKIILALKSIKFFLTDGPTDRQTDKLTYRALFSELNNNIIFQHLIYVNKLQYHQRLSLAKLSLILYLDFYQKFPSLLAVSDLHSVSSCRYKYFTNPKGGSGQ